MDKLKKMAPALRAISLAQGLDILYRDLYPLWLALPMVAVAALAVILCDVVPWLRSMRRMSPSPAQAPAPTLGEVATRLEACDAKLRAACVPVVPEAPGEAASVECPTIDNTCDPGWSRPTLDGVPLPGTYVVCTSVSLLPPLAGQTRRRVSYRIECANKATREAVRAWLDAMRNEGMVPHLLHDPRLSSLALDRVISATIGAWYRPPTTRRHWVIEVAFQEPVHVHVHGEAGILASDPSGLRATR